MQEDMSKQYKCHICGNMYKLKGLSFHIIRKHNMTVQQYYDTYLKKEYDGICLYCGNPTKFVGVKRGYNKYCCNKCSQLSDITKHKKKQTCLERFGVENSFQSQEKRIKIKNTMLQRYGVDSSLKLKHVRAKTIEAIASSVVVLKIRQSFLATIRNYEKQHNCTWLHDLVKQHGQGILSLNLDRLVLHKHAVFIPNYEINKILQYKQSLQSSKEFLLYKKIQEFYNGKIIQHNRTIIAPYELDIYIPSLKLAIEYNGTYWHSTEAGTPIDYHLKKSLLCREQNIRLIHIYEFEDIYEQLELLKQLILFNNDTYNPNDFNKNTLINNVPNKPVLIYNKTYSLYGAGQLYL